MNRRRFLALLGAAPVLVACDPLTPSRGVSLVSPGSPGAVAAPSTTSTTEVPPVAGQAEDWHYVGEAGEPAFENSWENVPSNPKLAFRIRESGILDVYGTVGGGASDTTIFTLPEGYRPSNLVVAPTVKLTSINVYDAATVRVAPEGGVQMSWRNTDGIIGGLIACQIFLTPPDTTS